MSLAQGLRDETGITYERLCGDNAPVPLGPFFAM
jgi:hypothetical protein